MILFKKIRWKNLLSTGNIFTEIDLSANKTTLIIGKNGAGKSTILDALTFVLFGKPFRNINKPQLMNSINKKNLIVELEIDINGAFYKIIRGIKPTVFEIYKNDQLIDQSADNRDYQEILEKQILKLNYKSFCQVVVLGSASFVPFMQLPSLQRRSIIEDLLDLQIFTVMNSLLKDKIQENTTELGEIGLQQRLLTEKKQLIIQHIKEKNESNQQIIQYKKDLIVETNQKIQEILIAARLINSKIESLEDQIKEENYLLEQHQIYTDAWNRQKVNHSIIKKNVDFLENNSSCPTCQQIITTNFKEDSLSEYSKKIEIIHQRNSLLSKNISLIISRLEEIKEKKENIMEFKSELYRLQTQKNSYKDYIKQLNTEISSINQISTNEDKIDEIQIELEAAEKVYQQLIEQKNILHASAVVLKDSGVKAQIIKQYVPIINQLINKYLSAMDFFVQFELDEQFNETIKSRFRDDFSYSSFSEGEKMRINLAILFTWRAIAKMRNSVSTNLLIMDEVMDSSMDANGTDEFLKILGDITNDNNTFIISHKSDQISDNFENIIVFEKKKNFSRIATGV